MDLPLFDHIDNPVSPQSPTTDWHGLEEFESTAASFFITNNSNVNANEEGVQATNILEFSPAPETLQLERQGRRKELTNAERLAAYRYFMKRMENTILKKGSTRVVAAMFGVGVRSIQRLWKRGRESGEHDHQTSVNMFVEPLALRRSCSSDPLCASIDSPSLTLNCELSSCPPTSSMKLAFSSFSCVFTIAADMYFSSSISTIFASPGVIESGTTIFSESSNLN